MSTATFPVDLNSVPVYDTKPLHDVEVDISGTLWCTDVSIPRGVRAYMVDPSGLITTNTLGYDWIPSPSGVCDGIAYDPSRETIYVQVWYDGVYKIDTRLPKPWSMVKMFSTSSWRGDHLSVSYNGAYLFGVGWDAPQAWRYTLPNGPYVNLDTNCMYVNGNSLDGTACLVPFMVGNPTMPKRPYWQDYVFYNHMSSELFVLPIDPSIIPIACSDAWSVWKDPSGSWGGEGVAAPGDGFVYTYNAKSSEIWRFSDPPVENVRWMPIKPGSSVQANLFCLMHAAFKSECIQPAGLMHSLILRYQRVMDLINARKFIEARKALRNEVIMGLQGIERNHVTCPLVLDTMLRCANVLLGQMSE